MFFTWKRLFALQGQNYNFTKTLFWKHQMIEQKICDPLAKILLFLDLYFERYACLKIMSQPMSQLMTMSCLARRFFGLAQPVSRPMSRPPRYESTHESTPVVFMPKITEPYFLVFFHRGRPMSRPPSMSRPMSRLLWRDYSATASF